MPDKHNLTHGDIVSGVLDTLPHNYELIACSRGYYEEDNPRPDGLFWFVVCRKTDNGSYVFWRGWYDTARTKYGRSPYARGGGTYGLSLAGAMCRFVSQSTRRDYQMVPFQWIISALDGDLDISEIARRLREGDVSTFRRPNLPPRQEEEEQ